VPDAGTPRSAPPSVPVQSGESEPPGDRVPPAEGQSWTGAAGPADAAGGGGAAEPDADPTDEDPPDDDPSDDDAPDDGEPGADFGVQLTFVTDADDGPRAGDDGLTGGVPTAGVPTAGVPTAGVPTAGAAG
jgi:hypothetical protein